MKNLPENFAETLLYWYDDNRRDLPWRENTEPYRVWLSEIMLQQTRIEAVKGYFARFTAALPTVRALAEAPEETVLKLWEGLGYYSRARNLHRAARCLCEEYGGEFPRDYEALRRLPGVGDYTAGAIASIAFGLPEPAVDGNVLRVYARLCGCEESMGTDRAKKSVRELLRPCYAGGRCGELTSAIMELGEVLCVPGTPRCEKCPFLSRCEAARTGRQAELPVLPAKKARRAEQRTVLLLRCGKKIALRKRPETGLLAGLWEFPNILGRLTQEEAAAQVSAWGGRALHTEPLGEAAHVFSHIEWHMTGWQIDCEAELPGFVWTDSPAEYALPTAFRAYRKQILVKN